MGSEIYKCVLPACDWEYRIGTPQWDNPSWGPTEHALLVEEKLREHAQGHGILEFYKTVSNLLAERDAAIATLDLVHEWINGRDRHCCEGQHCEIHDAAETLVREALATNARGGVR